MTVEFQQQQSQSDRDWFEQAFNRDYLYIYSHRDDSEAEKHVKMAIDHVPFSPGHQLLDIACGTGRHLQAFAQQGANVTGIDLSDTMLAQAKKRFVKMGLPVRLEKHDMRKLPFSEEFDAVTMWFTSFGYFKDAEQDCIVLRTIAKVLKPNGWWWIDLPNPIFLTDSLVPETKRNIKGPHGLARVVEKRRLIGDRVEKIIEISDEAGKREYTESVRLYKPDKFKRMLQKSGLSPEGTLGDYDGIDFGENTPRQIWYGRKA